MTACKPPRLAQGAPESADFRASVNHAIPGQPPSKGAILAALRRSPLADADLDLKPRSRGGARGRHLMRYLFDTIIAAVAEANDCVVVTGDEKDFDDVDLFNPLR